MLALLAVAALLPEAISPHDPLRQDLGRRLLPPVWSARGTWQHPLGTDQLGRDVTSRIVYGTGTSLGLGVASTSIALVAGTILGLLMGYMPGRLSVVVLRITDVQLAFPFLILAIAIVALFGPAIPNLILVLVLWAWPSFARLARAEVLIQRELEYVMAARAMGAKPLWILFRDILPNTLGPLGVLATLTFAQVVVFESALSFLGFGLPPPAPTWGGMLSDGRDYVATAWWLVTFPGVALIGAVLSANEVGDYVEARWRTR
jgi:peptide/nickel transport system permease protein